MRYHIQPHGMVTAAECRDTTDDETVMVVKTAALKRHITHVCKSNIKRDAIICKTCPFRGGIQEFMNEHPTVRVHAKRTNL
jgi:hypothetical protein